jgi:hypothetical protein
MDNEKPHKLIESRESRTSDESKNIGKRRVMIEVQLTPGAI